MIAPFVHATARGEGWALAIPCPVCGDGTGNCYYGPDDVTAWCIAPARAGDLYDPEADTIWWRHDLGGAPCPCGAEHGDPQGGTSLFPPALPPALPPPLSPLLGDPARPCPICGGGCRYSADGLSVLCASAVHAGFLQESALAAGRWAHALAAGCGCGIGRRGPGGRSAGPRTPRPQAPPSAEELLATVAALRAALAAAHDRIAALSAELADAYARIDRLEVTGPEGADRDAIRQAALDRAARRELVEVLGRRDLTPTQRVVI